MSSGIFLPFAAVADFSPMFQVELNEYVQAQMGAAGAASEEGGPIATDESEEPAELSVAQAKKFLSCQRQGSHDHSCDRRVRRLGLRPSARHRGPGRRR